ncbi:hypothetical protein RI367_006947 [Sorochytrium milnesiophthora]
MRLLTVCALLLLATQTAARKVTFDKFSLILAGRPTFIWSGEMHAFRLPSPNLWLDVLQKMKAIGFNTVSLYFSWAYHSPKPGVYDFAGVRNMTMLLETIQSVGLYAIARPGPYINAEVYGGGFPGWLSLQAGAARSDAADYIAATDEWLTHINRILEPWQYEHGGPIILYQLENELANTDDAHRRYMQHLHNKVRRDGITVPLFHNDMSTNGLWVPASSNVSGIVPGPVDLYAFDGYPGGTCSNGGSDVGHPNHAPDWGIYSRASGQFSGSLASPETPGMIAEFGGGWFDYYGSRGAYPCTSERQGAAYERAFYGVNLANRITIHNVYMAFGGTSWGWMAAPQVYTSYDYGAAITEGRQLRPKAHALKQLGYFVQSFPEAARVERGADLAASVAGVRLYHNVNVDGHGRFVFATHNPNNAVARTAFSFALPTRDGEFTVPAEGELTLEGHDARWIVADVDVAERLRIVYTTSQILTRMDELLVLYGRKGEAGELVLYEQSAGDHKEPDVVVLQGAAGWTWDSTSGTGRLAYTHDHVDIVVQAAGCTLLIVQDSECATMWRQDTPAGPVLVAGPTLVRTATYHRSGLLSLTGDTRSHDEALMVWMPSQPELRQVQWNGQTLTMRPTKYGSLQATALLKGPAAGLELPNLEKLTWRVSPESPEAYVDFDDSAWKRADLQHTNSSTQPRDGHCVLTADDYGFHQGDVWYRGKVSGKLSGPLCIWFGGGAAGLLQLWLGGEYIGQSVVPSGVPNPPTTHWAEFTLPVNHRPEHALAVMVRTSSHNEDFLATDTHKEGRGLIQVDLAGENVSVAWRVQGNQGGEDLIDPVRGILNAGGLYGERNGWHLPGYPDKHWASVHVPCVSNATLQAGTTWYRTQFDLAIPSDHDVSLALTIGDPNRPQSAGNYRALIFVNGWQLGQYIAQVGPQHTFVLMSGILITNGSNTLAIAVTSNGGPGDGLEAVQLVSLGAVRGGVPVANVRSPSYQQVFGHRFTVQQRD